MRQPLSDLETDPAEEYAAWLLDQQEQRDRALSDEDFSHYDND